MEDFVVGRAAHLGVADTANRKDSLFLTTTGLTFLGDDPPQSGDPARP